MDELGYRIGEKECRMIYVFGEYELDTGLYELRRAGAPYKVEPKAFDLLIYLIQHRDRVVTREELFERVWSAPFISEAILSHHIMVARKAVGDDGRTQRRIKTIHGRGYRFIARVDVREQPDSDIREVEPPARTEPVPQPTSPFAQDAATRNVLAGDHALTTVLCATLDNIAALSEQLGFEVLQRLRQMFFTHAQDVVQRYEGMLQFFGADGVLSVFKSRTLHADHAQRAVSAALDLQHRLRTPVTEVSAQTTISGSARMGLHTGPIAMESLSGDTVNLAVWLQYQAQPGRLLVSAATMQRIRDIDMCIEPIAIRIPGHADPIMAYQICGLDGSGENRVL
jgi:DNA-binding winged helix-turn-helix (wHTH) protein